jgi:hypothetical protein
MGIIALWDYVFSINNYELKIGLFSPKTHYFISIIPACMHVDHKKCMLILGNSIPITINHGQHFTIRDDFKHAHFGSFFIQPNFELVQIIHLIAHPIQKRSAISFVPPFPIHFRYKRRV